MKREPAVIFDVDGTLALRTGDRSPYDMTRVGEDEPNGPVVEMLRTIVKAGDHKIVVTSGRDESARRQTEVWFACMDIHIDDLFMRRVGDQRPDNVVKLELYRRWIEPVYDVRWVVDDRRQVVSMWRRELGLLCAQVAEGDF